MQSDYQLSLRDYIGIVRRRGVLIISVFGGVFSLAVAVAIMMPPVYQSTGTIMVESQQIPTDLVQATVTSYADERIETIKQRVMTRDNLFRIAKKYQLFADAGLSFTPSEAVDEMRSRIGVELVNANVQARQRATIAFKVSFEHRRPDLAQRVANELVTLFLDENVKVRTERATQTTAFLTQEADKLRADLDKLESQIATYKMQHGGALPDNMTLTMNSLQRMETELRDTERDQRAAQDELRGLEIELASAKAGIGVPGSVGAQNAQQELVKARADLARVAAIYTENHPDVRALKRKIEGLEKTVAEEKNASSGGNGTINSAADLQVARLESRVAFCVRKSVFWINSKPACAEKLVSWKGRCCRRHKWSVGWPTFCVIRKPRAANTRKFDRSKCLRRWQKIWKMSKRPSDSLCLSPRWRLMFRSSQIEKK